MDALRKDDIEIARTTPPAEKLRQALQMVETGIRLKRAGFRERHPAATPEQIEAMLQQWLLSDE
jgi:Rv0078B-related antitoxin